MPSTLDHATVSVVIPTWNRAQTLVAAVESALNQTHPPLEVLVCDDGSSDDSEARIRALGDPRVRWLSGPRGGRPAIPRNRGIAAARGDWLAFLDSDDTWNADKLAQQLAALTNSGNLAACTNAWRVTPGAPPADKTLLGPDNCQLDFPTLLLDNRVICSSALVHRSLLGKTGAFPEHPGLIAIEDYSLWLRIVSLTRFDYLGAPLVNYRDDPVNSVRAKDVDYWTQRRRILANFIGWGACNGARPAVIAAAIRPLWNAWWQPFSQPSRQKLHRLYHTGLEVAVSQRARARRLIGRTLHALGLRR